MPTPSTQASILDGRMVDLTAQTVGVGPILTTGTVTGNSASGLTLVGEVSGVGEMQLGLGTFFTSPAAVFFDLVNSRIQLQVTGSTAGGSNTQVSDRLVIKRGSSGQSNDLLDLLSETSTSLFKIAADGTATFTVAPVMSGVSITAGTVAVAALANIAAGFIGRDTGTGAPSLRTFAQVLADLTTQAGADFDWNGHKNINLAAGTATTDSAITSQIPPPFTTTGKYTTFPNITPATNALATNTAIATPMFFPVATSVASIGIEVTTGGTAGSIIRFGIYTNNAGVPGTALFRSGTGIASTSSAATAEDTSAAGTIVGPGWVWLVYVSQTAAPTVRICTPTTPIPVPTPVGNSSNQHTITQASVSGALPSPWTGTTLGGNAPMLFVKAT